VKRALQWFRRNVSHRDNSGNDLQNETPSESVNAEEYIPPPGSEVADIVPVENWVYWPSSDEYEDRPDIGTLSEEEAKALRERNAQAQAAWAEAHADAPADANAGDDLPPEGMSEQQIRDAGGAIDLPYVIPEPAGLKYKDTGQQVWTPPPGWRKGLPPLPGQEEEGPEGGGSADTGGGSASG
jgi:hypothetical protein